MKFWKKAVLVCVMLCAIGSMTATFAQEETEYSTWDKIMRKFGRGISNVAFGGVEIPLRIYKVNNEDGGFAAVTYGLFKGISYFVARECVGVAEIVTFPAPLPGCTDVPDDLAWGYSPIIYPEWVLSPADNAYNIVYPQTKTMQ